MRKVTFITFIMLLIANFTLAATNNAKERQTIYKEVMNSDKMRSLPTHLSFVGKWATVEDTKNFEVVFFANNGINYASVNVKFIGKVYNKSNKEVAYEPAFTLKKVGKKWQIVG